MKTNPERKPWAFLVYIAGDNNLSDAGLADVQELCDEGSADNLHVGVEMDTYGELKGSIRWEISKPDYSGQAHRTVIERLPEQNTGDPETLRSFLSWGFNRFPAERTVVVVWNHGSGFRGIRRDIAFDDFGSSLDMPEMEDALKRAGVGPGRKIGILGFDACLMNMLEITHHFRDQVEIIVGSQQTEPGEGWPYDKVLASIKTARDCPELAQSIVNAYIDFYKKRGIRNVTQSAVDTSKTQEAVNALSALGGILAKDIASLYDSIRKVRLKAQVFEMADYVDLVHLAGLLTQTVKADKVVKAAKLAAEKAAACVLANKTLGASVKNASGLSVWFPAEGSLYSNHRSKYLALNCNRNASGWVQFLDAYHSRG